MFGIVNGIFCNKFVFTQLKSVALLFILTRLMTLRKHRLAKGHDVMGRIFSLPRVFHHAPHPKKK